MYSSGCVSDAEEVVASYLLFLLLAEDFSASLTQDFKERHIPFMESIYCIYIVNFPLIFQSFCLYIF